MRTVLLDRMVETTEHLPAEMQDSVARLVLDFLRDDQSEMELTPEDEAAIAGSRAESERGDIMSDEAMRSIWAKYDR